MKTINCDFFDSTPHHLRRDIFLKTHLFSYPVNYSDTSTSGHRLARELTFLMEERGSPQVIVSDNGTELTSKAILDWQVTQQGGLILPQANLCRMDLLKALTVNC